MPYAPTIRSPVRVRSSAATLRSRAASSLTAVATPPSAERSLRPVSSFRLASASRAKI